MKKLQPHKLDREAVRRQFQDRHRLLEECARRLEAATCEILHGIPRIDRVYFRAKSVNSFVDKACHIDPATSIQKYASPFDEIEDQVAPSARHSSWVILDLS